MGLIEEINQLVTNLAGVVTPSGQPPIRRVYNTPPIAGDTIAPPTSEDLPAIVVFLRRPPVIDIMTFSVERRTTTYVVQFIYTAVGGGIFANSYTGSLAYCEPILDVLWSHQQLNGLSGVSWSVPKQETVPMELPEKWGGQPYFGVDFTISTVSTRQVTIGT